ncbi:MAG: glycosyltransferase family 39 protein [Planctomycetota bacterium]|nr:glycosyltransferase family 39 protein [Planctomycetota bacterium]
MKNARALASISVILAVALGLRCGAAVVWQTRIPQGKTFAFDDSETYWYLARTIAEGSRYAYGDAQIFRTPGYPLQLAAVIAAFGETASPMPARLVGAVQGTIVVGLVMVLARMLFSWRVSLVAGWIVALEPGSIAMSILVLSESLFCPFMLACILAWVKSLRATTSRTRCTWSFISGVLSGLATLTRPSWLLFTPCVGIVMFICGNDRRVRWASNVFMFTGMILVMAPWWVRNYNVAGRFVATTLQVGASLYDGWNPEANGASDMEFVPQFVEEQRRSDSHTPPAAGLFEDRLDKSMQRAALEWAGQNPGKVLRLMGVKFLRTWSPWPHAEELQSGWLRWGIALSYLPLIGCGLCGALRYGNRGWDYALCLFPAFYFSGLHMIFVGSLRYRQPPLLLLIVLAAAVIVEWLFMAMASAGTCNPSQQNAAR